MTAAYWEIGRRIVRSEQGGQSRAGYGQALIAHLAEDLTRQFGRGFGRTNLANMRAFYLAWPEGDIFQTPSGKSGTSEKVQTSSGKLLRGERTDALNDMSPDFLSLANRFTLPWSAYVRLLSVKTLVARAFYESEALRQGWSVRQMDRQISSQLYERLALSRNKAALLARLTKHSREISSPQKRRYVIRSSWSSLISVTNIPSAGEQNSSRPRTACSRSATAAVGRVRTGSAPVTGSAR
nr:MULTISPECIES: DUF1016 N-terminal domain-containing protein [unclassified Paraburkholderia]